MAEKHEIPQAHMPPGNGPWHNHPLPPPSTAPVTAPQQTAQTEWSHSFWDCCSPVDTCLCGWCGPCCLFGKTQSRLEGPAMKEHSYMNGDCCLYACLSYCGFYWVLLVLKRGELRKRFGIEGSGFGDCMSSYCCPCCVLVQHEKEVELRSNAVQTGYQPTREGMTYPQ